MKRPRNFSHYEPTKDVAAELRQLADYIEKNSDLAKFSLAVSVWNKEWDDPDFHEGCMTQVTYVNRKAGREMGLG